VNNGDNFYIRHNKTSKVSLFIAPDGVVSADTAVSCPRYDFVTKTSNPGSANTLWYNSASDSTHLMFGANKIALMSDIGGGGTPVTTDTNPVNNEVVLYGDTSGNRKTATSTTVSTLGGYGLTLKGNYFTSQALGPHIGPATLWLDSTDTTRLKFGANKLATQGDITTNINTLKANLTLTAVASNPGGATTLWANSSDNGLQYGDAGVVTSDNIE
jgi:hypothetical protein